MKTLWYRPHYNIVPTISPLDVLPLGPVSLSNLRFVTNIFTYTLISKHRVQASEVYVLHETGP